MHEAVGRKVGAAELGGFNRFRVAVLDVAGRPFCDRDVDMRDVADTDAVAQFKSGIDRGVTKSAAGIRLDAIAVLHEVVGLAQTGKGLKRQRQTAGKAGVVAVFALERFAAGRKSARTEQRGEYAVMRRVTGMQRLTMCRN